MDPYDFYSPFMSAVIVTPTGERFPLAMNTKDGALTDAGRLSQSKLGFPSLSYLEQLTIEMTLGYIPKITATFTPPMAEGMKFIDSELSEWGLSHIEVQFGYASGTPSGPVLSPPFTGLLLKPDVQIGADINITLNAQGVAGYSMSRTERNKGWNNATREQIIKDLVAGPDPTNARQIRVDVSQVERGSDKQAYEWLCQQRISLSAGGRTDWMLVWQLVREAGCWMTSVGDNLRIFPRADAISARPVCALRFFDFKDGRVGPGAGVFPIISATSPTSAVFLPGALRGLVARSIDSKAQSVSEVRVDDKTDPIARTGTGAGMLLPSKTNPGVAVETGDGTSYIPVQPGAQDALQLAKAEYESFAMNMGIHLQVETLGIPDLLPGQTVEVAGLGKRFSMNYGIMKITHTLGSNGYTSSLELVSNVGRMFEQIERARGAQNTKQPDYVSLTGETEVQAKPVGWSTPSFTGGV